MVWNVLITKTVEIQKLHGFYMIEFTVFFKDMCLEKYTYEFGERRIYAE